MQNKLTLTEVFKIREKINKNNEKYLRITFKGFFDNHYDSNVEVRTSLSIEQWEQLKEAMHVSYQNKVLTTENSILLEYDPTVKRKTQPPKIPMDLVSHEVGVLKSKPYDYWDLSVMVLVQNEYVKSRFDEDYSKFF